MSMDTKTAIPVVECQDGRGERRGDEPIWLRFSMYDTPTSQRVLRSAASVTASVDLNIWLVHDVLQTTRSSVLIRRVSMGLRRTWRINST
jgi:hypothetical protein